MRTDVGVLVNLTVLRHQHGVAVTGGSDDDLVSWIAVKRRRQAATLGENRPGQFGQVQSLPVGGRVEPVIQRTIQHQLAFLGVPGHSQIEVSDSHSASPGRALSIARRAWRDRRRSSLTHQTQAWVSRSVDIPRLPRAERIADFLQDTAGEAAFGRWGPRMAPAWPPVVLAW